MEVFAGGGGGVQHHTRTVQSEDADASVPSGSVMRALTTCVWPFIESKPSPLVVSQTCTMPPYEPEAKLPSSSTARQVAAVQMPGSSGVPHAHRLIVITLHELAVRQHG